MRPRFGAEIGLVLFLATLFAALALFVPYFLTAENLVGLALSVSMVGMVACSMLFCLTAGDFDLSVEGVVVLSGVICAVVLATTHQVLLGIVLGLGSGVIVGLLNGLVVARFGVHSLIATLAMLYIVRGTSFIVSNGSAVGIAEESFYELGNGSFIGLPNPVWITALLFVVFGVLLNLTTFGRATLAIGGNAEAARKAGINVARTRTIIFGVQGLVAAAAGIILASRMTSGQPNSSSGFALDVIAACMLGGVSHRTGTGNLRGVIVGVLIMGVVQNAMSLIGIPTFYQYVTKGGLLLAAVIFDQLRRTRSTTMVA